MFWANSDSLKGEPILLISFCIYPFEACCILSVSLVVDVILLKALSLFDLDIPMSLETDSG
jgi:hypothetical protein